MDGLDAFIEIEKYSHLLLGRLAIERGFISYKELLEGLQMLHQKPTRRLGTVLVKKGYITVNHLKELLHIQKKLRSVSPVKWKNIPDTVFKGLYYFGGYQFGQMETTTIRKAEEIREEYQMEQKDKSLAEIIVEDMKLADNADIINLKKNIHISHWKSPCCSRIFYLYNISPEVELLCPVCWEQKIIPYRLPSAHRPQSRKIEKDRVAHKIAEPDPVEEIKPIEKKPKEQKTDDGTPRANAEMLEFYAALHEMQPKSKAQLNEIEKTESVIEVKKQEKTVEKKEGKTEAKKKKELLGQTMRTELQKLYQQIEENIDNSPRRASGVSEQASFSEKQTQNRKMSLIAVSSIAGIVAIAGMVLWYYATRPSTAEKPKNPYILDEKAQAVKRPEEPKPTTKQIKETKVIRDRIKMEVIAMPLYKREITQDVLKTRLKNLDYIIERADDSSFLADYHHLKARILFSRVWIDTTEQISHEERIQLLKKAMESADLAKDLYSKETTLTEFNLKVMPWMWEAKEKKVNPWDKYFRKRITCKDRDSAARMVEKYIRNLKSFLEREKSYGKSRKSSKG